MRDVPLTMDGRAEEVARKDSEVWVRLADGTWGGGLAVQVSPDTSTLLPVVTGVTPNEATPGGDLLIEGSNFGSLAMTTGGLSLTFGSRAIPLEIQDWSHEDILAKVKSDISGELTMTRGKLQVTNRLGLRDSRVGVSFVPVTEISELVLLDTRMTCQVYELPPLCFLGDLKTKTLPARSLLSGWTVQSSYVDTDIHGISAGAYFSVQPVNGSSELSAELTYWADAFSYVDIHAAIVMAGPRGTSYR